MFFLFLYLPATFRVSRALAAPTSGDESCAREASDLIDALIIAQNMLVRNSSSEVLCIAFQFMQPYILLSRSATLSYLLSHSWYQFLGSPNTWWEIKVFPTSLLSHRCKGVLLRSSLYLFSYYPTIFWLTVNSGPKSGVEDVEQLKDVANMYKTHKIETSLYIVLYGDAGAFLLLLPVFCHLLIVDSNT